MGRSSPATRPAVGIALALALALRDRGGAQATRLLLHAPWVDLTDEHPGHRAVFARTRGCSSASACVRRVVGRVGRGAGPAGGLAGPGRPGRAAAGADVLRHPGHPGARLPAAASRAAEAGWDLTYVELPDLIHVFPMLPFIPEAGGPGGRRWGSCGEGRRVPFDEFDARDAYDVWRLRQQVFVVEQECPYADLDGATASRVPGTSCSSDDDGGAGVRPGADDGTCGGSAGWPSPRRPAAVASPTALMKIALRSARTGTSMEAQSPLADWYNSSGSRCPVRSTWTTGSRTCRCGGPQDSLVNQ